MHLHSIKTWGCSSMWPLSSSKPRQLLGHALSSALSLCVSMVLSMSMRLTCRALLSIMGQSFAYLVVICLTLCAAYGSTVR